MRRDIDITYEQRRDGNSPSGFWYTVYDINDIGKTTPLGEYNSMDGVNSHGQEDREARDRLFDERMNRQRRAERETRQAVEREINNINEIAGGFGEFAPNINVKRPVTIESLSKEVKDISSKLDKILTMLDSGLTSGEIEVLEEDLQLGSE